ncbi:hypothetical protein BH09PSE4_BH09PSE4_00770 [soil metagenome]
MRRLLSAAFGTALLFGAATAQAQSAIDGRVDRLESEMRAVQRKVFPGGSGQYFQPEITPGAPTTTAPGTPATNPVSDLNGRVNALESQMATITGNVEQVQFKLRTLEEAFNAYKRTTDARLKALEDGATSIAAVGDAPPLGANNGARPTPPVVTRPAASSTPTPATSATKPATSTPAASTGAKPDAARAKAIAAIPRPATGDAAEDNYNYGYRLWQGGYYPEAELVLKEVVTKYPQHRRASYAQNLLGRSYLDEGRPSLASIAFYDNYKKMPEGERALDSLYYLAQALVKLNKPADACRVYAELSDYDAKLPASRKADIVRGRAAAKCQ